MGQKLVSKTIFQPPKGVDMVCLNNIHYVTTSNNLKIPLLWFPYNTQQYYYQYASSIFTKKKKTKKKQKQKQKQESESESENMIVNESDEISKKTDKNKNKKKNKKNNGGNQKKINSKSNNKRTIKKKEPYTILFSHANAESIFQLPILAQNFVYQLKVNVCLYEYCGYPFSQGKISEKNCYLASQAALRWLNEEKGIPKSKIIIMGHSLGAAVATDLASRNPDVYGLVLMSAFLSCVKVPNRHVCIRSIDMFENWEKAPKINIKTLLIHGEKDEIVEIKHGKKLYQLFPNTAEPLWIKDATHNNIEWKFSWKLYPRLRQFIYRELSKYHKNLNSKVENIQSLKIETDRKNSDVNDIL
ncbi:alpha/beta hydrolase domain-containing protein [Anaeramoeba flamelloides]|uniref:Alpha/beta hydrolase domain-containing protein n=1 Tax=Anaeramoeba flamelloides TaxID=1746091 RepID=A0AAV7YZV6_9EUKA|nr:alpha/beta hydrolase domain-containing protein [Anaeramoeba flamelloides]